MTTRSALFVVLALLAGLGLGHFWTDGAAGARPAVGDRARPAPAGLDPALAERLVTVLEALERRLAEPRVATSAGAREPAAHEPLRAPAEGVALANEDVATLLRSIDASLARMAALGGPGGASSLGATEPTRQQRAWDELVRRHDPMRPRALERFFFEHEPSFRGELEPELFFLQPWDVLREFGWPTTLERHSPEQGGWFLYYGGLSIVSERVDEPIVALEFHFTNDLLVEVAYDTE
ncbi:MAG: hypothetical protein H6828_07275 [Planctomycetes bacterium]|nr:hypothetical protein [Planctomycetota bacterium]